MPTFALCVTLFATALSRPQEGPVSNADHLKPLEFLIGTWGGAGKLDSGDEYLEELKFDWMQDRNFIKSEYAMKVGERVVWSSTTVIGYDAELKKLVVFAFAKNGTIARSVAADTARKDTWVFLGKISGPFPIKEDRVTTTKVDEETLRTEVEKKEEGNYVLLGKYTYKKKK